MTNSWPPRQRLRTTWCQVGNQYVCYSVILEMMNLGNTEIEIAYISLTDEGVLGEASEVVRLRRDKRCWLRKLNLRKDSRLRLARLRRDAVLLKPPPSSPPPPADLLSTLLETKLRVPWRERRTFPIQPDTCEWATDNLSPRYSISQDSEWVNWIKVCPYIRFFSEVPLKWKF